MVLALRVNRTTFSPASHEEDSHNIPSGNEYGTVQNLQSLSGSTFVNTTVRTNGASSTFTPTFSWNSTNGFTIGASHGHPGGSAPSPADAVWPISNLNNPNLLVSGTNGVAYYKNYVSMTAVTINGTYVITVKDWAALQTHYNNFHANPAAFNANYITIAQNNGFSSEYALLSIFGNAINVYKAPVGSTAFEPIEIDSNNIVMQKPCP